MKWIVLILIVLAVALVFQMGLLAFSIYMLLAILWVSRLLVRSAVTKITVRRVCSHKSAEVGDRVSVAVELKNESKLPIPWVLIQDVMPYRALVGAKPALQIHGRRIRMALIRAGKKKVMAYQFDCQRRGYFQVGPLLLETGDVFGLFRKFRLVDKPHFVLVMPQIVPLDGYALASRRPIGEVVLAHRRFEDPTRILGVRDYQSGDPFNRIHWKASARTGQLQSKTYEPSTIAGATLVIDFHHDSYHKDHEPVRSDLTITAAASIANGLYEMGQQIGLVSNGRDAADRVRVEGHLLPKITRKIAKQLSVEEIRESRLRPVVSVARRGPEAIGRILELLARLELNRGLDFGQLLIETASRIPRDATVVACLSHVTESHVLALSSLRQRGFSVSAILNIHDDLVFSDSAGPLMSVGIDVHWIKNQDSIATVCRNFVQF